MKYYPLATVIILLTSSAFAQLPEIKSLRSQRPIVCYANPEDQHTHLGPPELYKKRIAAGRVKSSTIIVEYINFTAQAQAAFQHAVDIWETMISSDVPIHVRANWTSLGQNVLGSAIWGTLYANFDGAQRLNTWYPVALAEKMSRQELNGAGDPDIVANFNSQFNWYYGTTGTPTSSQYDLVTVVLHELGHGLGFVDSFTINEGEGHYGYQPDLPIIYDQQIENVSSQNLYMEFSNGTADLASQLVSNNLFYNTPSLNSRARLYAPTTFSDGSSIAHLNEATFASGTANSLMTPQVGATEVIHDPGPIAMAIFEDMGWKHILIDHTPLPNREDVSAPLVVTATLFSDDDTFGDVELLYSVDGGEFQAIQMSVVENENVFQAEIPTTGNTNYEYYIRVTAGEVSYTNPGKFFFPVDGEQQAFYSFKVGPDTEAPVISHSPVTFVSEGKESLVINANIVDEYGLDNIIVEYRINDAVLDQVTMTNTTGDTYSAEIPIASLFIGDMIEYRIVATDKAQSPHVALSPAEGFHVVNVVGLEETVDFYANDFNEGTNDFFGNGFSIEIVEGFDNGAIHSLHPYEEGDAYPNDSLSLVYQLKNPIRVAETDALIKFDEIVLVEPGEAGSTFGSQTFYDYVVVEGSNDSGITWTPIANGYDARSQSVWLTKYNSSISGNNSTAQGDPSLYRERVMDLLNVFEPGDEVAIRFRLYSDQLAVGWGWAIDNLRIQIDEEAPVITHDHINYITEEVTAIGIKFSIHDSRNVSTVTLEYQVNDESMQELPIEVNDLSEYDENVLTTVTVGDKINYRIIASDDSGNESSLPSEGFITIEVIEFAELIDSYENSFDEPSTDFVGNFFSISTPDSFSNPAIHSSHPYPSGFGQDGNSDFSYMLKTPILISESNPYISFKEIVIVEGHPASAVFGSEQFKDYVIVEGSKDFGATWSPFQNGYDLVGGLPAWNTKFNNGGSGTSADFKRRVINMTASGDFQPNDEVLIRFRMFSNLSLTGWGWAIDDLAIQSSVTGLEDRPALNWSVFPNPASDKILIKTGRIHAIGGVLELIDSKGNTVVTSALKPVEGSLSSEINISMIPKGLYLIRLNVNGESHTKKIIKE